MGFQVVASLPTRATFPTTFLTNCGKGGSFGTTTCLKINLRSVCLFAAVVLHSQPINFGK